MFKISEELAERGGNCPLCGKYLKRGELGPSDVPIITSALSALPTTHVLSYGARYHDVAYHMGTSWGTRLQADNLFLDKNKEKIASLACNIFSKFALHAANYRNYWAVRCFGAKFWDEGGCKNGS